LPRFADAPLTVVKPEASNSPPWQLLPPRCKLLQDWLQSAEELVLGARATQSCLIILMPLTPWPP